MKIINMNAPGFVDQFRDAIGAEPGDAIEIVTPTFTRPKSDPAPASAPTDWVALRTMSRQALKEVGLRAWDEPDGHGRVLMLLPGEWYQHIPRGYEIVDINGNAERFEPGVTDDDIRFGCLAYGIVIVEGGDRGLRRAR